MNRQSVSSRFGAPASGAGGRISFRDLGVVRSVGAALVLVLMACVSLGYSLTHAQVLDPSPRPRLAANMAAPALAGVVYSQPIDPTGKLLPSSWWDPNGSDYDQYVWDDFTLQSTQTITEVTWFGGFDPSKFGSGGPVTDFTVAIYASIAGGLQPDVVNPPLVKYHTGGAAGQTSVGTVGGVTIYSYDFVLPAAFQAVGGTKYWVQIEAFQNGIPDWCMASGTGGDGQYFRRRAAAGDFIYQLMPGDAAFVLLGPVAATETPTVTPTATTTPTATPTVIAHLVYLPLLFK